MRCVRKHSPPRRYSAIMGCALRNPHPILLSDWCLRCPQAGADVSVKAKDFKTALQITSIDENLLFSRVLNPQPSALNPQPSTLNPQPSTRNTQHSTLNTQHSTLNPQPARLNTQPSTLNPQHSTLSPLPSTLNSQPSTLNLQPSNLNPQPSTLNSNLNQPRCNFTGRRTRGQHYSTNARRLSRRTPNRGVQPCGCQRSLRSVRFFQLPT